jgi:hypothetical protein
MLEDAASWQKAEKAGKKNQAKQELGSGSERLPRRETRYTQERSYDFRVRLVHVLTGAERD